MRRLAAGLAFLALAGCGGPQQADRPDPTSSPTMAVTSSAFGEDEPIPKEFSCDGDNTSPPLAWNGVPADAVAMALVVDDPDAPRGTYTHWVVLDIPPDMDSIEAGKVPAGAKQAKNSAGKAAYAGPCPPDGTHHYRFTVYALYAKVGLPDGTDLSRALGAIDKRTITHGRLTGKFTR